MQGVQIHGSSFGAQELRNVQEKGIVMENLFRTRIKEHLDSVAAGDPVFAEKYGSKSKSLGQCCDFICTQVKKSGRTAFADDEIFCMAVHYYDEENPGEITDGASAGCSVVCSAPGYELSEIEKEQARQKALDEYRRGLLDDMKNSSIRSRPEPKKEVQAETPSLF